jgi:hypothetical protein
LRGELLIIIFFHPASAGFFMVETVLPNLEREQRQQIVLIEDDLLLRFRATAETLDIEIAGEMEDWLLDKSFQFRQLLAEYTSAPIAITGDIRALPILIRTKQNSSRLYDNGRCKPDMACRTH